MALFRCGSGAGEQKTTLWTNPDPTQRFLSSELTMSDDLSNYSKLKVTYCLSKTETTTTASVEIPMEVIFGRLNEATPESSTYFVGGFVSEHFVSGAGERFAGRYIYATSNTKVLISDNQRFNLAGDASYSDFGIPTMIEGIV